MCTSIITFTMIYYPSICFLYCLSIRIARKLEPILADFGQVANNRANTKMDSHRAASCNRLG